MTTTDTVDFLRYYAPQSGLIGAACTALLFFLALALKRRYGALRPILVDILDGGGTATQAAAWGVRFLTLLTLLSVLAIILETEPSVYLAYGGLLMGVEVFALSVFTLELLLRLYLAPEITGERDRLQATWRYLKSPMGLVDLLTVLPGWFFFFPGSEQLVAVRVLRVLRLLKLGQYAEALGLLDDVLRQKRDLLLTTVTLAFVVLVLLSTLMFVLEGPYQPEKLGSIPQALWWGMVTMATIGYGDVVPITPAGKLLSGLVAFLGIGLFALPTAILATGLLEVLQQRKDPVRQVLEDLLQAHQEGRLGEDSPLWQEAKRVLKQ
ncbi:Cyclic nucleotide-gated potassium channel [Meiothermus luteus]|uniref:Cyclic nucleotide-gated potassium channel n=1 Tax=Meiothermus luteus TaxID=2026184 RepID=A0A399EGC1_9DEIN|nr:potassium channel family protein [Meiothermus luteus]RIH83008.1 Cyclic nucleotide-gated potassium channel [Meiothermus luteus]RMH53733.1 MAG: two pore domain potassium channel family protein [Deinococcota bacterium]